MKRLQMEALGTANTEAEDGSRDTVLLSVECAAMSMPYTHYLFWSFARVIKCFPLNRKRVSFF